MTEFLRRHWTKISTGLLLATLAVAGGAKAYAAMSADSCCYPGSSCCHPGSPCCHHGDKAKDKG